MLQNDASQTATMAGGSAAPDARSDVDALPAGSMGPETGNVITAVGTLSAPAGADMVGDTPATVVAIRGQGGGGAELTPASSGPMQVAGTYGTLTIDGEGNYSYVRSPGTPTGVQDVFTYTLANAAGGRDTATLTILLRDEEEDPVELTQTLTTRDGVVVLPAGVELSDIRVVGRDLVITLPDGSTMTIPNGAVFVPQLVIGDVEVPPSNLAALLIEAEPQPAAGIPQSSGGNFADPVPPLDPGVPLGDLLPPTQMDFTPPTFEEAGQFIDREPEVLIQPDGQPASAAAVDSVDEEGLPPRSGEPAGSNQASNAETTTGTILIDSADEPNVVTINGVVVTSVGQTIAGTFGTLTITSISDGAIGYSYTLADNLNHATQPTHDDFTVSVTDNDGDVDSASLRIDIIDDVPTARPDTDSIAAGQFGPATGNVITDAAPGDEGDSDTNAADTVGADDATLTSVSGAGGSDSSFNEAGNLIVQGQYGVLTIAADGSYSYTRDAGTPGGVTDTFDYTLTDGDGSTSSSTLTISIGDLAPTLTTPAQVQLDDDALPGGNPGGVGDDPDAVNTSGTLVATGGDGDVDFAFSATQDGLPDGFTANQVDSSTLQILQGSTVVLTITLNNETGAYSVVQNNPIDHPDGNNENNIGDINVGIVATDVDGDRSNEVNLTINVDDDTPEIGRTELSVPTLTVDETNLAINASGNFSVLFDVSFGADGPGTTSYAVSTVNGTDSGLVDVASGESILLFNNDGVVEGRVGGADGAVAFTVTVDEASGVVTLDQVRALEHLDATNPDDTVSANATSIQLTVTATDADMDPVSQTIDIGANLTFDDDGPSVSGVTAAAGVVLDETTAGDPAGFPISATSAGAVITATTAFGADGAGTVTYGLSLQGGGSSLSSGLATAIGDHPITLVQVDADTIEGRYSGTNVAFTIEMNDDGTITVTQEVPLEHLVDGSTAAAHDDPLDLGALVNATVTVTDRDGDSVTGEAAFGDNIVFRDDGPSINVTAGAEGAVVLTTQDAQTIGANDDTASSTADFSGVFDLTSDGGADGAAGTPDLDYTLGLTTPGGQSGLTQSGAPIYLYLIGGTVVGSTSSTQAGVTASNTVFDVTVSASGVVTLTQYSQIDHPAESPSDAPFADQLVSLADEMVTLTATSTITDNDGDTATDSATVNIGANLQFADDGPDISAALTGTQLRIDETDGVGTGAEVDPVGGNLGTVTVAGATLFGVTHVHVSADSPTMLSYALTLSAQGVNSGLLHSADNDPIFLYNIGGTIHGSTSTTLAGVNSANTAFTVSINSTTGAVTLTQFLAVEHSNTASHDELSSAIASGALNVTVTATDFDGDTDTASADLGSVIRFEDDGPTAVNDTDSVEGEGGTATGNVITDAAAGDAGDSDNGADTVGSDVPGTITAIESENTGNVDTTFSGGLLSIQGEFGTLTIDAQGNYTYTRNDGLGGGETEVFTYTLTDADGDTDTATLTIEIKDETPTLATPPAVQLDDDALAGGNPGGTGDDPDAVNTSGTLSATGGDGDKDFFFSATQSGLPAGFTANLVNASTLQILQGSTVVLTVTLDNETGAYTVVQNNPIDHPVGSNENNLTFNVSLFAEDVDGDPSNTVNLTINVDDDTPVITASPTQPTLVVDETVLATNDTESFAGVFTASFGADGPAGSNSSTYTLGINTGATGIIDTATGEAVVLSMNGGVVEGRTASSNLLVFTVSVNSSGSVTLDQLRAVVHNDPNDHDEPGASAVTLASDNLITLTRTITDGDGDSASATANIGQNLQFEDDGPDAVNDSATQATENTAVTVDVFANDDAGADDVNLTTGIAVVSGSLTGSGSLVYNGDGTFTYTPAAGEEGSVQFQYRLTDRDGDSDVATVTIELQPDSDPVAQNAAASVDDEGLANGITGGPGDLVVPNTDGDDNEATFSGTLTADFGADAPGSFSFASMHGDTATIGTEVVVYSWSGNTLTATVAATDGGGDPQARSGTVLFTVSVTPSTGAYTLTLVNNVLHVDDGTNTENDASAALTFTATDSEGETDTGTLTVTFDDDMPEIDSVTDPLQIDNDSTPSGTGTFDFGIGADQNSDFDDITVSNFTISVNGVALASEDFTFTEGTETATHANYSFTFTYDTGDGGSTTADGTLVFNKADGTYTVTLDEPIAGFSILDTGSADASDFVSYQVPPSGGGSPEVTVAALDENFFVQFSGVAEPGSGTGANNLTTTQPPAAAFNPVVTANFNNLELFTQEMASIVVSSSAAGVGGNTIQGGEVLDFNLYATDPGGTLGQEPTTSSESMFIKLDGVGTSEDMIIILKLYDTATDTYTTKAVVVENQDIIRTNAELAGTAYAGITLDNNDGLIVIEANDYQEGNTNLVIVGAQIAGSDEGITGTGINLNGDVGSDGGSTGTQALSTDVSDAPFKITSIGFLTDSTEDQNATLEFDVTVEDADGDSVTVEDVTVQIGAAAVAPASLPQKGSGPQVQEVIAGDSSSSTLLASETVGNQLRANNAASNNTVFLGALAAAGLVASPLAAHAPNSEFATLAAFNSADLQIDALSIVSSVSAKDLGRTVQPHDVPTGSNEAPAAGSVPGGDASASANSLAGSQAAEPSAPTELLQAVDAPQQSAAESSLTAQSVSMPSAEALAAAGLGEGAAQGADAAELGLVIADALAGGAQGPDLDALIAAAAANGHAAHGAPEAIASLADVGVSAWDMGGFAGFTNGAAFSMEALMLHPDAPASSAAS